MGFAMETRQKLRSFIVFTLILGSFLMLRGLAFAAEKRAKVIDFDDEVVEGLNKRPLDSLSQISEKDRRKHKPHLYRKRASFRTETAETLRQMKFE